MITLSQNSRLRAFKACLSKVVSKQSLAHPFAMLCNPKGFGYQKRSFCTAKLRFTQSIAQHSARIEGYCPRTFSSTKRFTSSVQESQLYSINQIRQNESPWISNLDIAITDRKIARPSFFKKRLQERKKIRILYGDLSDRKIDRYLSCVHRCEELIILLESRLDIVCRRSSFFQSILCARQSILHGGVSVNSKPVFSPGYQCMPGDLIQVIQSTDENKQKREWRTTKKVYIKSELSLDHYRYRKKRVFPVFTSASTNLVPSLSMGVRHANSVQTSCASLYTPLGGVVRSKGTKDFGIQTKRVCDGEGYQKLRFCTALPCFTSDRSHYMFFDEQLHKLVNTGNKRLVNSTKKYRDLFEGKGSAFIEFNGGKSSQTSRHNNGFVKRSEFANTTLKKIEKYNDSTSLKKQDCVYLCSQDTFYSRPLHLEISYTSLSLIFLYPPQKVCLDITLDFDIL